VVRNEGLDGLEDMWEGRVREVLNQIDRIVPDIGNEYRLA